ncbi:UNVERIFIED_CONTAM: hypothetical protein Sindi_0423200 [Sesamum indicum]
MKWMYSKNLPRRAGLTLEFEDGLETFIKWAKCQRGHMDRDKIKCPCRKCKNTKFRIPDDKYFKAVAVPPVSEEQTPTSHVEGNSNWGYEQHMDWAQRMIFYASGPSYFSSSHDSVPDDGTSSRPVDVGPNSYYYCGGPYDYELGFKDRFYNGVHVVDQPLWNSCTQSQLASVVELVDIKHEKVDKRFEFTIEKIDAYKNGCMLYRKDDVDLEYCKFCKNAMYKPTRGRDPCRLPLTPYLQRLYSLRAIAEHMTWHATHQIEEGSMVIYPMSSMEVF